EQMVALLHKRHKRSEYRAHARSGSESVFGAFKRTYSVHKLINARVTETGVNIIFGFVGKSSTHLLRILKSKTAGKKKWGTMFHFACTIHSCTDGLADGM